MRQTFRVEPITQGYVSVLSLAYPASFVAVYPLMTGQLTADFRAKVGDAARLFRAATVDGSIVRTLLVDLSVQIDLTIPASTAATFPLAGVTFDLAHVVNSVPRLLPGQWYWPVKTPVTVLP